MSNKAATVPRPDSEYAYWRWRILIGTMIGYIFFYFVRKSITMAMPGLEEIGVTKTTLGAFLTIHGVLYGFARFINGIWSDRANPRYFMSIGLFLAALTNIFCGFSGDIVNALMPTAPDAVKATRIGWIIGSFWIINGWVQGMGFPPCAKSLMHWFAPREHGVKFATWNISHSVGAGLIFLLNAFVVLFGWKYCFIVPACLSIAGAAFLFWALRDSPEKEGFEPVEVYYKRIHGEDTAEPQEAPAAEAVVEEEKTNLWSDLCKNVFSNWAVWVLCFANFFVYIVRFSILDWAPTFLSQSKGLDLSQAGGATACYEIFGAVGCVLSGVLMDKVFRGRGSKACFVYMLGCCAATYAFLTLNSGSILVSVLLMSLIGLFIYGPQCLIGCVASTIATKKSAAASSGLTGLFGYLATIVTGLGVGAIVDNATAPVKADRDRDVAAIVARDFDVDAESMLSGEKKDGFASFVKSAEAYYDAERIYTGLLDGKDAKKLAKAEEKYKKAETKLNSTLETLTGTSGDLDTNIAKVEGTVQKVGEWRAEISKAGWPIIFKLLVVSSIAALILFAAIFNAASPEVLEEERRRKEQAQA